MQQPADHPGRLQQLAAGLLGSPLCQVCWVLSGWLHWSWALCALGQACPPLPCSEAPAVMHVSIAGLWQARLGLSTSIRACMLHGLRHVKVAQTQHQSGPLNGMG